MRERSRKEDSGFPITNVGNDRGGLSGMTEGGFFVEDDRGWLLLRMTEEVLLLGMTEGAFSYGREGC